MTGDKRYHGIYVVHQAESVVLSDDSVLRYAMGQRQADTQNTKSNREDNKGKGVLQRIGKEGGG